jgi:hypothetical protein
VTITREELAAQVDEAHWEWLRAHLERGGIIVVDRGLDVAEVGLKIAADDTAAIQALLVGKQLGKPSAEQIAAWDTDPSLRFSTLIISPYVLIQEQ